MSCLIAIKVPLGFRWDVAVTSGSCSLFSDDGYPKIKTDANLYESSTSGPGWAKAVPVTSQAETMPPFSLIGYLIILCI
jgi:hypothetical protein